jgi:potassium/chloride transporter 9
MVFVEYEHEVDEESARVRALLEKLRIDAQVLVFYLASGHLDTYELIVNGSAADIDTELIVGEALKDEEWWEDLQIFRGQPEREGLSPSQELSHLAHILDATTGRPGAYNPHDESGSARRQSMAEVSEMPRRPDIATLAKLGVSMGIHTTHINAEVLQESESDTDFDSDAEGSIDDDEEFMAGGSDRSLDPRHDLGDATSQRPLLQTARDYGAAEERLPTTTGRGRRFKTDESSVLVPSYGTMDTSRTLTDHAESPVTLRISEAAEFGTSSEAVDTSARIDSFPVLDPLNVPDFPAGGSRRSRSMSPARGGRPDGTMTPARPNFSRQSSAARFSSRPVPETKITIEGEGSKISFAPAASNSATPRAERPAFSRHSSLSKFSSRPLPDTKICGEEDARKISFAEQPASQSSSQQHSRSHSRHHSRHGSQYSVIGQDPVDMAIPEHVEAFKHDESTADTGSAFSGHLATLSFNDLPSRAQYLILNELMRQRSRDAGVLMTTLPIPSEGTSLDEMSTIQYLSDVELLCNDLPPTLMVLSNNMTVTVSL